MKTCTTNNSDNESKSSSFIAYDSILDPYCILGDVTVTGADSETNK